MAQVFGGGWVVFRWEKNSYCRLTKKVGKAFRVTEHKRGEKEGKKRGDALFEGVRGERRKVRNAERVEDCRGGGKADKGGRGPSGHTTEKKRDK